MLKPRYHELSMKWMLGSEGAASKGAWKRFKDQEEAIDREEQAFEDGGRVGFDNGGQLVQPGPGRQGYAGKIQFSPPDNYPGTKTEWEALDSKKRFRWRHPGDQKKWNIKRKEKGGDWFTSDFSKREFDKSLLEKIEKEIVGENVKTGKTRTLTQLLTDAGVPVRMAKHPSLKENRQIKKATKTFLSLPQKVNNYLENVILNADTVYDDIKYPMQHIAKKFSTDGTPLAHKTLIKYLEDNPLYKQNKSFLEYLGKGAVNKKYSGAGKTIGDMMFIVNNRIAEPFFAVKGPDDFIMKSAYRSFMEGKQLGTGSSINFIGDPTMQDPSEWIFEHKGKVYAQNSALDKVELPGDNRFHNKKINNLRIKDANKIYSKPFGEVYNIFDDLNKYRDTELINPRTKNKSTLDWMTREAYAFERGYSRDARGVQIDHGKGLKNPFTNLRLMNREKNQTAGNIIRQNRKNPELVKKMLDEINYNKPYNFDEFIKLETDRVIKVLDPKNFDKAGKYINKQKPSLYSSTKETMNMLKKMGYRCLKSVGAGEDVACYLEDVKKTRKDLRSTNVEVRAKALTKQRAAKQIAEKIPGMSKMIKGARGTLASVGGLPGIVFEGLFEVGAYDYYRRKGYNHEEASAEALFFGKMAGVGGDKTGLLEGADKLIEKRIAGTEPARLKYISNLNKNLGDQDKLYNDISSLNKVLVEGSQFTTPEMKKEVEDELELKMEELTKLENKSNLKTPGYDAWLIGQEKLDHEHGMAGEAYIKNRYGLPESEEATQKRLDAKYPRRLQEMRTYKTGVGPGSKFWTADIPEDISKMEPGFLHDYYEKDLGYKPEEVISQKWKDIYEYGGFDELDKVGIAGGYSKMAKGGIATLSGKRSKPMPQGLNYLMRKK